MSDNVSEVPIDLSDPTVVEKVLNDKDLRKLPLGSEEFKAAAAEMLAKTDETAEESATDATEHADDESSDDSEAKQPSKGKPKRGVEKRIDELVKEREALRRELEAVKNGAQPHQVQQAQQRVEQEADSDFGKPKPRLSQFENLEDYTEALTDWRIEKKEHDRAAVEARNNLYREVEEKATAWENREAAFKATVDDYDAYVHADALQAMQPPRDVMAYLAESEFGPQLAYTILSDEETAEQFKAMSPLKQIGYLAKLEARFEADEPSQPAPAKKTTVSKAPQPAKSLPKGKAVVAQKSIFDKDLSFAEYNRLMDERERAKRARK